MRAVRIGRRFHILTLKEKLMTDGERGFQRISYI